MRRLGFARRSLRRRSLSCLLFSQAFIIAVAGEVGQAGVGRGVSVTVSANDQKTDRGPFFAYLTSFGRDIRR